MGEKQGLYTFRCFMEKEMEYTVAYCLNNGTSSYGRTPFEAKKNLGDALDVYCRTALAEGLTQMEHSRASWMIRFKYAKVWVVSRGTHVLSLFTGTLQRHNSQVDAVWTALVPYSYES